MAQLDEAIAQSLQQKKKRLLQVSLSLCCVVLISVGVYAFSALFFNAEQGPDSAQQVEPVDKSAFVDHQQARSAIQQRLNQLREALQQLQQHPHILRWAATAVDPLSQSLDLAFAQYAAADYHLAGQTLAQLQTQLDALQQQYQAAYTQAYKQGLDSFNQQQIDQASIYNQRALEINPDYAPAVELQQRIAVYAEVQKWQGQLAIAQAERNIDKQYQALQRLVAIDPSDQQAQQQLARLEAQRQQERFSQALQKSLELMHNGELVAAQQQLAKAAKIAPEREELVTVQARLSSLLKSQGLVAAQQQIDVFIQADEWATVKMLADNALLQYPDSEALQQAQLSANKIIQADAHLQRYLARPQRLTDSNIRQYAQAAMAKYTPLAVNSVKLARRIEQLKQQIATETQAVAVTLRSDNKTHIRVLGVGVVGKIKTKSIQLTPGRYQLEGSRDGYRSKIVELVVSKSSDPIEVELVCSEKV